MDKKPQPKNQPSKDQGKSKTSQPQKPAPKK